MLRVDLTDAQLRWCDFRGLDPDTLRLPSERSHVIIRNLPDFLPRALHRYSELAPAPGFVAVLRHIQKWRGPHQSIAILGIAELSEMLPQVEIEHVRQLGTVVAI